MIPTPMTTTCEHCKKVLPKSDCKYVKVQRYVFGRFQTVDILVCADRCTNYYAVRQNIKTLQYRLRCMQSQRRSAW
ncbi:Uncharacterised protein [Serratia liquefaciens]|nr:Uncharacterised protein [Serratia liquefaciens]